MEIPEMQHQIMGYDRSATMFSPDGHILQVEYAEKTIRLGSASVGIKCSDGILIIADRGKKDELIVPESAEKIYEIDDHILAGAAGILSDARILINQARILAQQHKVTYDSPIDIESIIRELSDIKQQYTQHPGVRPFGVSLIIAGIDEKLPKVYTSDITGNYFEYKAIAIGKNDEIIKNHLRKKYKENMKIEDAIKMVIEIFKEVLKEDFDIQRFDLGYIKNQEEKIVKEKGEELKKYLK